MRTLLLLIYLVLFSARIVSADPTPASASDSSSSEQSSLSDIGCPNAHIIDGGMFTKPCWSAMLPITIGGFPVFKSKVGYSMPSDANTKKLCACGGDLSTGKMPSVGTAIGMRIPTKIVEVVRRPYCFPTIGGIKLTSSLSTAGGERSVGGHQSSTMRTTNNDSTFYNWHFWMAPFMTMAKIMDIPSCNPGGYGGLQIAQLSETFPNWYKPELSALVTPEAALLGLPMAIPALISDCVASTIGNGFDWAFMAAGCWGVTYPFNGSLSNNSDPVRNTRLMVTKALSMLTRLNIPKIGIERTIGTDALCKPKPMWTLKKSQYQIQMLFPVSESKGELPQKNVSASAPANVNNSAQVGEVDPNTVTGGTQCSGPIGRSTLRTGDWRHIPTIGEDHVYLLWQWVDCCVGVITPAAPAP